MLGFGTEHDGSQMLNVTLWCNGGIQQIDWEPGTTANGTGSFSVSIPEGTTSCHWMVNGDGNWQIYASPE